MTVTHTWYGHSAVHLESGDDAVLVDPFISGTPPATVSVDTVDASTIILTHARNDHVGGQGGSTKFVPAWHTSSHSTTDGDVAPGVPAGHVVRFGGKTMYFAGDTCHYNTFPPIRQDPQAFKRLVEERTGATCVVLDPGQRHEV